MAAILRLDKPHIERLRQGLFATSLAQVAAELLQNALDASPQAVEILINVKERSVEVRDDGRGIAPEDFQLLGQRLCQTRETAINLITPTSKTMQGPDSFGFRGEALSSIGAVSSMQITSKSLALQTYSLFMKGGKVLHCGPASSSRKPGTSVVCKDLFFNIPARQSQILKESWDSIRKYLDPIILISKAVKITVIDLVTGKRMLSVKAEDSLIKLYGQVNGSQMIENASRVDWSWDNYKIEGFMSTAPFPTKTQQYCYVNKHFLSPIDNPLYAAINSEFARSKFAKQAQSQRKSLSPQKNNILMAYPLFFINITCEATLYDLTLDAEKKIVMFKDWDAVILGVMACTSNFLVRHKLLTNDVNTSRLNPKYFSNERDDESLASSRQVDSDGDEERNSSWKNKESASKIYQPPPAYFSFLKSVKTGKKRLSEWEESAFDVVEDSADPILPASLFQGGRPNYAVVTRKLQPRKVRKDESTPNALDHVIQSWENPVFQQVDLQAATTATATIMDTEAETLSPGTVSISKSDLSKLTVIGQIDKKFIACWFTGGTDRERNAAPHEITSSSSSSSSLGLVIIDQHAADERVKLENLFVQTFGSVVSQHSVIDMTELDPPIQIALKRKQRYAIMEYSRIFSQWGIGFVPCEDNDDDGVDNDGDNDNGSKLLKIKNLPGSIAVRCIADPSIVKELLLEYLAQFEEASGRNSIQLEMTRATLGCPKGIIHLLNSKACRSAIMFGDELDTSVCKTLVRNLKGCHYPFQCAHGRPSMTLVSLLSSTTTCHSLPFVRYPLQNLYSRYCK
ncbi:hypothetical protein BDR26DRAFT_936009 [Obelidium mucronatum]|nr:hypothetical protein BDR26DRAFT_936009 [Obelidium mucronatum]